MAFVIVGAGHAGVAAAEALRAHGFDGRVVLLGDEPHHPYERPPLSKEVLQGRGRVPLLHEPSWYEEQRIELRPATPAVAVDARERAVEVAGGERIAFDRLLLATGARPRRLPGTDAERVHYLRTRDDAERLAARLSAGGSLVVVGGGFIGAEVAASARVRGLDVTLLEALDAPLIDVLGPELAAVCAELHRDAGVDVRTGERVESLDGVSVTTSRGERIACDAVAVGIGVEPNAELARAAGIAVDNGILTDRHCATSVPGIFAAGDVANHEHAGLGRRVRVEHYDTALKHGALAARSMLGEEAVLEDPHWFWSDQYVHNLQYVGAAGGWSEVVLRGSVDERSFSAFYLHGDVVIAAFSLNRGQDIPPARKLIRQRIRVDARKLADPGTPLRAPALQPA